MQRVCCLQGEKIEFVWGRGVEVFVLASCVVGLGAVSVCVVWRGFCFVGIGLLCLGGSEADELPALFCGVSLQITETRA